MAVLPWADGYVGELVVAQDSELRGTGARLMAAAETWVAGRGRAFLTLETGAASQQARSFYAALGYQEEDIRLTKSMRQPARKTLITGARQDSGVTSKARRGQER